MSRPRETGAVSEVDPVDRHVGRRLRLRRALLGLSQERLAELAGLTFQQIQKYERGANRIGAGRLWQLAHILGVPVGWFYEELEGQPEAGFLAGPAGQGEHPAPLPGLAEPGVGFVFDPPRRPVAAPPPTFDRRETLELVRAFNAIADPVLRRRLYELVRAVSEASTLQASSERRST